MTPTDTSERGLETLIVQHLCAHGYIQGNPKDYQADVALDTVQLLAFLQATQPEAAAEVQIAVEESPQRRAFLHRLQGQITKRGVVTVLRHGISHGALGHIDLYHASPTPGNPAAAAAFVQNRFSVSRQVRYKQGSRNALDLVIFVNGLPVLTFELKNSLTKQTVADAIAQYQTTREPQELLFMPGRCLAHMAVDDAEVRFCTQLQGKGSRFLPFNRGCDAGAGNPPNPDGLKTAYLWEQVLERSSLANIIEHFAQVGQAEGAARGTAAAKGGRKNAQRRLVPLFPRFHQWRTVRALLRRAHEDGVGRRYLIQHSAGSGKSNTIAWLAYQLVDLRRKDAPLEPQFSSIIVLTDRLALDAQIRETIQGHDHIRSLVAKVDSAQELSACLNKGTKIIVTTVQKFPYVLGELEQLAGRNFALLIDEAHSSQGGKTTAKMHQALGGDLASGGPRLPAEAEELFEEDTTQDFVNKALDTLAQSRRMLRNASYFAFTATPKHKTLELFGERVETGGGEVTFRSPEELSYTTKQAIEEGFILDVIAHYTTVKSSYLVAKSVPGDPEFDKERALKKIRHYVETHDEAIARKAEIMVDHFLTAVFGAGKIGGQARAMIVCAGIARAVDYWHEVSRYLREIGSPHRAIIAYSGEHNVAGQKKTEADLNGFPSKDIPEKLRQDPYRFLIVANKFVTGFDEPLLHTMYVDKPLAGVQAVQTLSRLNRACPKKYDTYVLDFADNAERVREAFQDYYRSTLQQGETDANKLHDLRDELGAQHVYSREQVDGFVAQYLGGAERSSLDPTLDACVQVYQEQLSEDEQVRFKGAAKSFVRGYGFLAAILPYAHRDWEALSIFLNFLIPKLPAPKDTDLSRGVLDAIDMDSYRVEKKEARRLELADTDAALEPLGISAGGGAHERETDTLSNICKEFNEQFRDIAWNDADKIRKVITEEIPAAVAKNQAYQNALRSNTGEQNVRLEHDKALEKAMHARLTDHTELFKQFTENEGFKHWMTKVVYRLSRRHYEDDLLKKTA